MGVAFGEALGHRAGSSRASMQVRMAKRLAGGIRTCSHRDAALKTSLTDTCATLVAFLFFLSSDLPWYSLILLPFAVLTGSWACYAMPTAGFLLYPFVGLSPIMGATGYTLLSVAGIVADRTRWALRRGATL